MSLGCQFGRHEGKNAADEIFLAGQTRVSAVSVSDRGAIEIVERLWFPLFFFLSLSVSLSVSLQVYQVSVAVKKEEK